MRSWACAPDAAPTPHPAPTGRPGRHLIRSREFKTATDEHGNHQSGGVEREVPWVAITPVVNAIRVLERMVPDGHLLFDHHAHDLHSPAGHRLPEAVRAPRQDRGLRRLGEPGGSQARAGRRGHSRRPARQHRHQPLPPQPGLAHRAPAERPGRPGHPVRPHAHRLRLGHATEGYASRSRDGIHDLIDLETARAVADTVAALHDDLGNGGGISGPAARRAIKAAATAPRFAGTPITLASARKLLANEDAMIYDNPHALLLCHYKRDRALCHRDGIKDTPSLDHCVPGCGNIARTDQQAAQLRERALALENQAAHVPQPIGDRLRASAARLREHADKHDRTRITNGKDAG